MRFIVGGLRRGICSAVIRVAAKRKFLKIFLKWDSTRHRATGYRRLIERLSSQTDRSYHAPCLRSCSATAVKPFSIAISSGRFPNASSMFVSLTQFFNSHEVISR
jgi:hypothetical protein